MKYWPATAIRLISLIRLTIRLTIRLSLRLIGLIRLTIRLSIRLIGPIRLKACIAMLGIQKCHFPGNLDSWKPKETKAFPRIQAKETKLNRVSLTGSR